MLSYEKLKITTMTMVFILNNKIDIMSAFHLLPITLVDEKFLNKIINNKLPKHDIPGSIVSMNFKGMNRGLIRKRKKFFRNSINLDISTSIKNINLKLSPGKIQLCGAVSRENGSEAVTFILNHLKNIKMNINELKTIDYPNFVSSLTHFKGEPTKKHMVETIQSHHYDIYIHRYQDDFTINRKKYHYKFLNKQTVYYIYSLSNDMAFYSDYLSKMRNLLNFNDLYKNENENENEHDDLDVLDVNEVMVNYNYNVGFKINRDLLNVLIDGKNGFMSNYDNALVNNVTIELPYENCYVYNKRKNKNTHHTFLVYHSGAVTQSGPNIILMREAFNLFINTIYELKDQIML